MKRPRQNRSFDRAAQQPTPPRTILFSVLRLRTIKHKKGKKVTRRKKFPLPIIFKMFLILIRHRRRNQSAAVFTDFLSPEICPTENGSPLEVFPKTTRGKAGSKMQAISLFAQRCNMFFFQQSTKALCCSLSSRSLHLSPPRASMQH